MGTELKYFSGPEAVVERKLILSKLSVVITDIDKIKYRNNGSLLDEQLEVKEFMEIFVILDENPTIKKIIFTSNSRKSSASG